MVIHPGHQAMKVVLHQQRPSQEDLNSLKRKLAYTEMVDTTTTITNTQGYGLEDLDNKASHQP